MRITRITLILIVLLTLGACQSNSTDKNRSNSSNQSAVLQPKKSNLEPGPFYSQVYKAESVVLDKIAAKENVDEETGLNILINSCNEVKADFNNYLLDTYGKIDPDLESRDLYLDAEHVGRFMIWKLVRGETDCFGDFFKAADILYHPSSWSARELFIIAVLPAMYEEGRKYDAAIFTGFDPFLTENSSVSWNRIIEHP